MTTAEQSPERCLASAPEDLDWLNPRPTCQRPKGHKDMHEDRMGAFWSDAGSYGVAPSRYFGGPENVPGGAS
jgi:hypothetical protein